MDVFSVFSWDFFFYCLLKWWYFHVIKIPLSGPEQWCPCCSCQPLLCWRYCRSPHFCSSSALRGDSLSRIWGSSALRFPEIAFLIRCFSICARVMFLAIACFSPCSLQAVPFLLRNCWRRWRLSALAPWVLMQSSNNHERKTWIHN